MSRPEMERSGMEAAALFWVPPKTVSLKSEPLFQRQCCRDAHKRLCYQNFIVLIPFINILLTNCARRIIRKTQYKPVSIRRGNRYNLPMTLPLEEKRNRVLIAAYEFN